MSIFRTICLLLFLFRITARLRRYLIVVAARSDEATPAVGFEVQVCVLILDCFF